MPVAKPVVRGARYEFMAKLNLSWEELKVRKLEKAVAVSGICSGGFPESRNAKDTPSLKFLVDFGVWFRRWIFWWIFWAIFLGRSSRKKSTEKSTKKSTVFKATF